MAFIQTAEWQIAERASRLPLAVPDVRQHSAVQQALRQLLAVVGSALVHILLFYFFLNKMLGSGGDLARPGSKGESLLLFNLSDAKADEPKQSEPTKEQARETKATTSNVAPPQPHEWTVVPLPKGVVTRALTTSSAPPNSSTAANPPQPASSASGALGGGGNYDPYAGAAPQRLASQFQPGLPPPSELNASPTPIPNQDPLELDETVLNKLRQLVDRSGTNEKGVLLTVKIAPDGGLKGIKLAGGSRSLQSLVRALLKSEPLYRVVAPLTKMQIRQIELS